ncbi:MAG TPA: hypothetical protein PK562_06120, partial [Candidatus Omnitrophota bacterium]|nr:hypothetical protein [Candidatus Omnitrophota bacterium]
RINASVRVLVLPAFVVYHRFSWSVILNLLAILRGTGGLHVRAVHRVRSYLHAAELRRMVRHGHP